MAEPLPRGAERILEGLTEPQREAVTHGAGPLLIIAGAGTGKTTVITRRIAHLIATRQARPSEVLALTFTDKAAAEMEERVDTLVPYGYADVQISTFHAFGDRLIKENALELWRTPRACSPGRRTRRRGSRARSMSSSRGPLPSTRR